MIYGLEPQLAEGGKIKIGGLGAARSKRGGGTFRMPTKHDHFTITKTTRDRNGDLEVDVDVMEALAKNSDGKITEIPIVLHADKIDDVFPTSYALYSGRKLACRGDGESATRWSFEGGKRTSKTSAVECPCDLLQGKGKHICKPHGTLHCSLRVPGLAVAGAVYRWRTTSIISIKRMVGSLHQILATCGVMRGLPLVLQLQPVEVSPDGAPASTVYCCHLELRAKDVLSVQRQAMNAAKMRKALAGGEDLDGQYRKMIQPPASHDEADAEQAEIAQEFYSESEITEAEVLPVGRSSFGFKKETHHGDENGKRMGSGGQLDEPDGEKAPDPKDNEAQE